MISTCKTIRLLYFLFGLSIFGSIFAQHENISVHDSVKYTVDFKFKDGVYLSFSQVKSNSPISKYSLLTTSYNDDGTFYESLMQEKEISYFDYYGIKQSIETKNIWGYADKGTLYINVGGQFNRINIIGSISHFIANIIEEQESFYDPMFGGYGPYYGASVGTSAYNTSDVRQFILDFETGKVYDFTTQNVELLLMKDTLLYDEYIALRKKKRKQLKFYYIRKYNERNPLYILTENN